MSDNNASSPPSAAPWHAGVVVFLLALFVALLGARNWAGGWNDASRLASIESLVDHGTMSIDRSIYVDVPDEGQSPFRPGWTEVLQTGTLDRMYVNQKFYSDKPPVPGILLAGEYAGVQALTGLTARKSPGEFARTMTILSTGLAYALAVLGVWYTGVLLRLDRRALVVLTASFAFATVSVVYARHVNSHGMLLGVAVWVFALMVRLTRPEATRDSAARRITQQVGLGVLLGLAYTLESACGPLLALCVGLWTIVRLRDVRAVLVVGGAALPWVVAHHALNYALFGMIGPANALPAHFDFPGSVFTKQNMTGAWNHQSIADFLVYTVGLWVGRRGFLLHNLPLLLAVPGDVWLLTRKYVVDHRAELLCGVAWVVAVALTYGALSTTSSRGINCSVRWFVPLLAPCFLALAMLLKQVPERTTDLLLLSVCGAGVIASAWWAGPFAVTDVRVVLCGTGASVLFWGLLAAYRRSRPWVATPAPVGPHHES